ncbi:hypothetical protein FE257_012864 [Aspergillus nanangensis]|uniref:L-dopachrome isomerase n=1 Tax=Aspergillus nanangensis TaxID=2582783 RepID=A0AAD4GQI1_ASPNN|nr:hypothetical protein FE257_012864 [Aspergillus nanangensis]
MAPVRKKIDFSLLRGHNNLSSTSSTSLSPTIPVLESPLTYLSLTNPATVSEAAMTQKSQMDKGPARPSVFIEEKDEDDDTTPDLMRGLTPGVKSSRVSHRSMEDQLPHQAKIQYFEGAFNTRPPQSPRDRINQLSAIVVELKVNIMVHDVESLAAAIASHMARIYQKSDASMMVNIQQGACLRFGQSPFPAYSMKVFALPYLIAQITNLRNATFIQAVLQDFLHIPANRGIVLFFPVSEQNFAINGMTIIGEITRLEHHSRDERPGILKTISRSMGRRPNKSSSTSSTGVSEATTSSWAQGTEEPMLLELEQNSLSIETPKSEEGVAPIKKSRSLRQFLSRRGSDNQGPTGAA